MRNPKQKKFCHFQFHPSHPPSHSLSPFPHLHPFKEPSFHLLPTSSPLVLPPFISCLPTLPPNKRHVPSPLHHVSRLPNTRRNARVRALARGGSRSPQAVLRSKWRVLGPSHSASATNSKSTATRSSSPKHRCSVAPEGARKRIIAWTGTGEEGGPQRVVELGQERGGGLNGGPNGWNAAESRSCDRITS